MFIVVSAKKFGRRADQQLPESAVIQEPINSRQLMGIRDVLAAQCQQILYACDGGRSFCRSYFLSKITKGDDEILIDRQRKHVKDLIKTKFLPHMWAEMEAFLPPATAP